MTTLTLQSPPTIETMADLLERLGDIPPHRVRLHPAPGAATEQDVIDLHDRTNRLCELVEGVLVEKAMGAYQSRVAVVLIYFLETFLDDHKLGAVYAPDGMMRIAPKLVRIPDVSFVSVSRLPEGKVPREPIPELVPDLAVEVLSESNTKREMERKLDEYFEAGVRLVWYVDAEERSVTVYTDRESQTVLGEADTLDGGAVLPGFSLSIREWFDRVDLL